MDSDSTDHTDYDAEFARIIASELPERPQPIGPYMRWPLGAALVLMTGQAFAATVTAATAAMLLTGGHSDAVTNGDLAWTLAVMSVLAIVVAATAFRIRARHSNALVAALVVEIVTVGVRAFFVIRDAPPRVGPYLALAWAIAAVGALAVPSSRRYCTR